MDDVSVSLEPGDFLYQSDQELFLVVMEEDDDSYLFAVHGWREIDKERLGEYIDGENGKLHRREDVETVVEEDGDDDTIERYRALYKLFREYSDKSDEDGPHREFTLEDT